jgi:hypothetical protein
MAVVKKISELVPKGSALGTTDLLVVGVDNGTDYDLKSVTGAQILGNVISQTITDGVTTKAPSENVVFDALANKVDTFTGSRLITSAEGTILSNTSGVNSGDETVTTIKTKLGITTLSGSNTGDETDTTIKTKLGITTLSGSNTGDQDLSGYQLTSGKNATSGYLGISASNSIVLPIGRAFVSNNVTPNQIAYFDNSGNLLTLSVATYPSISELSYVKGVTSAIQTQINNKADGNTAITAATKTKITYDSKGLVTSGADATTADIADSLNKRYVTDANLTVIGNTSGTNTGDQDLSTYQPYTTATTGSVISFVVPQIYNSVASPSSSNITDSLTSAKIGLVQKIYHNHTVAPTFPAGWVKMGTATYTTSTLNVIFAEWVSGTRVEYWITKPS